MTEYDSKKPFRIAIVADAHVGPIVYFGGKKQKMTEYANELLEKFVTDMNDTFHPDVVLQLGDLIEDEKDHKEKDIENYKWGIETLSKLDAPVYHILGNHEKRQLTREELADMAGQERWYYSVEEGAYRFIALDPYVVRDRGKYEVEIPEEQVSWLEEELKKSDKPTIIFSHEALSDSDLSTNTWYYSYWPSALLRNRKEVRRILEDNGNVIGAFNGHIHWNNFQAESQIPYFTVQSLVENIEEQPAGAFTIVDIRDNTVDVEVYGRDPAKWEYTPLKIYNFMKEDEKNT